MADDFGAVLGAVGPRLRALRHRHGTTPAALPETTGIPISTLSRLEPGHRGPGLEPEPRSHEGHHRPYVLSGRLLLVPGDHGLVPTAGEVAEFGTHLPHWFGNAGTRPAEYLSILGPQGERFHIKARYRR